MMLENGYMGRNRNRQVIGRAAMKEIKTFN